MTIKKTIHNINTFFNILFDSFDNTCPIKKHFSNKKFDTLKKIIHQTNSCDRHDIKGFEILSSKRNEEINKESKDATYDFKNTVDIELILNEITYLVKIYSIHSRSLFHSSDKYYVEYKIDSDKTFKEIKPLNPNLSIAETSILKKLDVVC